MASSLKKSRICVEIYSPSSCYRRRCRPGNTINDDEGTKSKELLSYDRQHESHDDNEPSSGIKSVYFCNRRQLSNDQEGGIDGYSDSGDSLWSCSVGTSDENGIWFNRSNFNGIALSLLVWFLFLYTLTIMIISVRQNVVSPTAGMIHGTIVVLALACHAKTTLTNPGAVPKSARPLFDDEEEDDDRGEGGIQQRRHDNSGEKDNNDCKSTSPPPLLHPRCGRCESYKPPTAHHCSVCRRCIARMDHHCPWMNNCVGAANIKHFILFLVYTWIGAITGLIIFTWRDVYCQFIYYASSSSSCSTSSEGFVLEQLIRVCKILCIGALLFTTTMIVEVVDGLTTGVGTIDRLKRGVSGRARTTTTSMEGGLSLRRTQAPAPAPVPPKDVFGIRGYHTWWLPIDPLFDDYDRVMGFRSDERGIDNSLK